MLLVRWLGVCLLTVSLVVAGALPAGQGETRVALVIGNADYRHVPPLANPENDATAIAAKLAGLGFEVAKGVDLGLDGTRRAIERFGRDSQGADVALIFYAGHGLQVSGENFLLPVDARIERQEDLARFAIRDTDLHRAFVTARPRLAILILDACRNNPFAGMFSNAQGLTSGSASSEGLTAGVLIAFSAAPGAVAADGVDGNSPFTTALLRWIDRGGLEIGTMFRRVRQTVIDLTNGVQVPWVEESLVDDVFLNPEAPKADEAKIAWPDTLLLASIERFDSAVEERAARTYYDRLLAAGAPLPDEQVRPAVPGPSEHEDDSFVVESLIWLSIREAADPSIFRRFLKQFPDSTFADLAQLRLAQLDAEPAVTPDLPAPAAEATSPAPSQAAVPPVPSIGDPPASAPAEAEAVRPAPPKAVAPEGFVLLPSTDPAAAEAALGLSLGQRVALQGLLTVARTYDGPLDGKIGPMSRRAIGAFQAAQMLEETGYVDRPTLARLIDVAGGRALTEPPPAKMRAAVHQLAALARSGAGAQPVAVRVASIDINPQVKAYWRTIADRFEAEHPGTLVEISYQPSESYKQGLLVALGSETPPDIFFTWGGGHLRALAEAGFARDLTDDVAANWGMSFKPGALMNFTVDGQVRGVPMWMTLVSLWMNRTLLERAGVDPASLDSWDGFLEAVRRLKAAGITPLAAGGADEWPMQFYWGTLAQALSRDGAFQRAVDGADQGFEAPAFVQAGEYLHQLAELQPFSADFLNETNIEAIDSVATGDAAMILTGNWALPAFSRAPMGGPSRKHGQLLRMPFPPGELGGGQAVTYGGIDGWVVREGASDGSVAFLHKLASLEVQSEIASIGYAVPSIAGADTAIADPMLREVALEITASLQHQLFLDQVLGPGPGDVANDAAVGIASGRLDPAQAAAKIEAATESLRADTAIRRGAAPPTE